ncbi:50S ribosomal protein L32 [Propionibacterium australiense]|uniref:Large ribosomal subunit protein bL32 n=1 Tax=Propionibacterium australiense TaxID=119981 RepID=A0A383S8K0_9ACTN|nr:50S ribosomal protein L32 [Propionibacterium australiense]RLP06787.1 50S ribosomal protein L32 [Propionibacterium australiense]RLP06953.1 50S ribosomal protein L32 [Propionibacterium australiense]SYZ34051.1 rpmF_bact: ribosomal protein bL32 [Propionibacterium australiense]VEH92105.1 50S ribosomal protein L32 [Propionibacterium australiense]
MAVPKRKMSRSNTRSRRSQWKAAPVTLVTCPNPACRTQHLPHTACPKCHQYGAGENRRTVAGSLNTREFE